jgi:hypothetical protein
MRTIMLAKTKQTKLRNLTLPFPLTVDCQKNKKEKHC